MATPEQLSKLSEFDFIAVVDASGSMGTEDCKGRSRWLWMQESLETFCRDLGKVDADGIDLVLFSGAGVNTFQSVNGSDLSGIFAQRQPRSSTPLAEALQAALKLAGKSDKKDFIVVFTDGTPDDKDAAAAVIRAQANSQENDDDCTILFVQVGHDGEATKFLRKLDDDLTGCKFDIVDAKTIEEAEQFPTTADLIVAAIND